MEHNRTKYKRASELQQFISSMSRDEKLRRVARYLPCAKLLIGSDGTTSKCNCQGWAAKPPSSTATSSTSSASESGSSGVVSSEADSSLPLRTQLAEAKSAMQASCLLPLCVSCDHRMLVHGDMQLLSDIDLNRKVATVVQMEQVLQEMHKQTNPVVKQQCAEHVALLRKEIVSPSGKISAAAGAKLGSGNVPMISRDEMKKRQMNAIHAFRAYLARPPPFEKPVISEILRNFILHKYGKTVGEGRKRTVDKVYKHMLNALQKMELPDPKRRKSKHPNDHIYQLNYKRWRINCRGEGQDKSKSTQHKFADIFGRTMLLSVVDILQTYMQKQMQLPPEMMAYTTNFFKDFDSYVKDEHSLIFLENFPDHFEKLKQLEERIDRERHMKESGASVAEAEAEGASKAQPQQSITEEAGEAGKAAGVDPSLSFSVMDGGGGSSFEGAVISEVKGRDEMAKLEERQGVLTSVVVTNDGARDSLIKLTILKEIFSQQLPKMPKDYITRLVFDRNHKSVCLVKKGAVVGGICYRPSLTQGFIEIAFCAITADEQVKGYGTRLMNHLKMHMQNDRLYYFLTYADNFAIGYFKKQGFTRHITLPREVWAGHIKDYDGGTLMQCHIHPTIDYLHSKEMIKHQRQVLVSKIQQHSHSHIRRSGLSCFTGGQVAVTAEIPGVENTRWALDNPPPPTEDEIRHLHKQFTDLVEILKHHNSGWPFLEPVDRDEVPDYYVVIKDPIDLSLIEARLSEGNYYITKNIFYADLRRMVENCKLYNKEDTVFYKCAVNIQRVICDRGGSRFFK
eukprot:TRINITY_DN12202_c0_g1_i2.p1 TRINITY_DN12202_c0_g1~~TRINITY_DN12202_c0_g1_i2.p1  ORF type:complete len:793 (+),score=237.86 TRINITY_DN12202_c0_g1_i2:135-2513(+)